MLQVSYMKRHNKGIIYTRDETEKAQAGFLERRLTAGQCFWLFRCLFDLHGRTAIAGGVFTLLLSDSLVSYCHYRI